MTHFTSTLKKAPRWGWFLAIYCYALQCLFYFTTSLIIEKTGASAHAIIPKIPAIDNRIPLVPAFVLVYWYSYVFWFFGTLRLSLTDRKNVINWVIAYTVSEFIGFLVFCLYPTYVDRYLEGLFSLAGKDGIFNRMLWLTYSFDSGRIAYNCCPSYHCLFSMNCYMGLRRDEHLPKKTRIYTLIVAILIFMSTVLTKQHYIVDVFGGVGLSIVCNVLVQKWNPAKYFQKEKIHNTRAYKRLQLLAARCAVLR